MYIIRRIVPSAITSNNLFGLDNLQTHHRNRPSMSNTKPLPQAVSIESLRSNDSLISTKIQLLSFAIMQFVMTNQLIAILLWTQFDKTRLWNIVNADWSFVTMFSSSPLLWSRHLPRRRHWLMYYWWCLDLYWRSWAMWAVLCGSVSGHPHPYLTTHWLIGVLKQGLILE